MAWFLNIVYVVPEVRRNRFTESSFTEVCTFTLMVSGIPDFCVFSISFHVLSVSVIVGGVAFSLHWMESLVSTLLNVVLMESVCVSPFSTVSGVW